MTTLTKKAYNIIPLPETHDFSDMSLPKADGDAVGFYHHETGRIIGYAWYDVNNGALHMDLIYVLEKEQGHGRGIVQFLFEELNLEMMHGTVMADMDMRPYYFWLDMGADIDVADEDGMADRIREGWETFFEVKKENLIK